MVRGRYAPRCAATYAAADATAAPSTCTEPYARRRRLTEADFESALGIALAADDGGEFKSQVHELVLALKQSDLVDGKHDPPRVAYHGFISALYVVDTAAPDAAETAAEVARAANGRAAEVRDGIEEAARGLEVAV